MWRKRTLSAVGCVGGFGMGKIAKHAQGIKTGRARGGEGRHSEAHPGH